MLSHGAAGLGGLKIPSQSAEREAVEPKSVLALLVQALQFARPFPEEAAGRPVRIQPRADLPVGGPDPESSAVNPSVVSYLKFDGSCISQREAM